MLGRAGLCTLVMIMGLEAAAAQARVETQTIVPPPAPEAPAAAGEARRPETAPEIQYDLSRLPEPVRRMREKILEAARSGEIEKLRPVIESNELPPSFTLDPADKRDPIEVLRDALEDKEGQEILATLIEVLEADFVHVDVGTPQEMYVWPYFTHTPLDSLTPAQKVELFRIVTSYDFEQMRQVGAYIFYRVGLGPDGTWHFFVAGE